MEHQRGSIPRHATYWQCTDGVERSSILRIKHSSWSARLMARTAVSRTVNRGSTPLHSTSHGLGVMVASRPPKPLGMGSTPLVRAFVPVAQLEAHDSPKVKAGGSSPLRNTSTLLLVSNART